MCCVGRLRCIADSLLVSLQGFWDFNCHKVCYGRYDQLAVGEQPRLRTLANTIANGNKAVRLLAQKGVVDGHQTAGVKGLSAFISIPYFDISTDCTLDMMHITSGVVGRHLIKLITGAKLKGAMSKEKQAARELAKRTQAQLDADNEAADERRRNFRTVEEKEEEKEDKMRKKVSAQITALHKLKGRKTTPASRHRYQCQIDAANKRERDRQNVVNAARRERIAAADRVVASRDPVPERSLEDFSNLWSCSEKIRLLVESRCYRRISAPRGVAGRGKLPLTMPSEMKAHHWVNFSKVYGVYLIRHCMPEEDKADAVDAVEQLLIIIKLCLASTVNETLLARLDHLVKLCASSFNESFPPQLKVMMMHLLLAHMPATIRILGSVRGFWNFVYERSGHNVQQCDTMCASSANVFPFFL